MTPKIFEFAIVVHPTKKERDDGAQSRIVVSPEVCLAADERAAGMLAARQIPAEYLESLDRVEVAVRPF